MNRAHRTFAALAGGALALGGCHTSVPMAGARPTPQQMIRIQAGTPFRLHRAADGPADAPCLATQVDGLVARVAADTIHFERIQGVARATPREDCFRMQGVFVLTSEIEPGDIHHRRAALLRTGLTFVLVASAATLVLLLLVIANGP